MTLLTVIGVGGAVAGDHLAHAADPAPVATAPVKLPATAAVGQQANVSTTISHTAATGAFQLQMSSTAAVTTVNPDGSYRTRSTIVSLDVAIGAEVIGTGVNGLDNSVFEQAFAADGARQDAAFTDTTGFSLEQQQGAQGLLDAVSMLAIGFPLEPIAVGATWTSRGTVNSFGVGTDVEYQCRLTGLTGDSYTVDVTYSSAFVAPGEGGQVEAIISGWGSLTGSLTNPLVVAGSLSQTVDGLVMAPDGTTQPLQSDTSIETASEATAP